MAYRRGTLTASRLPGADTGAPKRGPGSVASAASADSVKSSATQDCVCICNICTCGQHHCPKPQPRIPFAGPLASRCHALRAGTLSSSPRHLTRACMFYATGSSTYQEDFPAYPICPQHGPVPLQWQPSGIPFEGTSEARSQFTPKPLPSYGAPGAVGADPSTRPKIPFTGVNRLCVCAVVLAAMTRSRACVWPCHALQRSLHTAASSRSIRCAQSIRRRATTRQAGSRPRSRSRAPAQRVQTTRPSRSSHALPLPCQSTSRLACLLRGAARLATRTSECRLGCASVACW